MRSQQSNAARPYTLDAGRFLRTWVAPVYRPAPGGGSAPGPLLSGSDHLPVCWLDELLGGGVRLPRALIEGNDRPLLWLMTGPPGTAKTMLALNLCVNLALYPQVWPGLSDDELVKLVTVKPLGALSGNRFKTELALQVRGAANAVGSGGKNPVAKFVAGSLYLTLDDQPDRLIDRATQLGWPNDILRTVTTKRLPVKADRSYVWLLGATALGFRSSIAPPQHTVDLLVDGWLDFWGSGPKPPVVVIDSLNALPSREQQDAALDRLVREFRGSWLVVAIHETIGGQPSPVEYLADIVTRMDTQIQRSYQLGSFQIVKMRCQEHAIGANHRWKVYERPGGSTRGLASGRVVTPRLELGGFYVYPSVHRLLSARGAALPSLLVRSSHPLPLQSMAPLLGRSSGQVPELPGCTLLLGRRGLLKSHLAYYWLLDRLRNSDANGLIVSFRDDSQACLDTLVRIADWEFGRSSTPVEAWTESGKLSILSFWPGYITPEEVMHNVVIRLDERTQVCFVNGIDHVPGRLPLCAELDAFLPALATFLQDEGRTSVLSMSEQSSESTDSLAIGPMADVVLRFDPFISTPRALPRDALQTTKITGERVAAGGISGNSGVLYRSSSDMKLGFLPIVR